MLNGFTTLVLGAPNALGVLNPNVLVVDEVPKPVAGGFPKMLVWVFCAPIPNPVDGCPKLVLCPKVPLLSVWPKREGAVDDG